MRMGSPQYGELILDGEPIADDIEHESRFDSRTTVWCTDTGIGGRANRSCGFRFRATPWPARETGGEAGVTAEARIVEHDKVHGDWVASLTKQRGGRVLQARYGSGPTAAAAALRAQKRHEQEQ
jgi:hypothetical protein